MKQQTILVADDDRHVRTALRKRLSALGYRVRESADGLGVLSECPRGELDAIILDQDMPNGDGQAIARVVRRESDVPIVFLSGCDRESFRQIVTQLPDLYFLPKPLETGKLADLLESLLEHKGQTAGEA